MFSFSLSKLPRYTFWTVGQSHVLRNNKLLVFFFPRMMLLFYLPSINLGAPLWSCQHFTGCDGVSLKALVCFALMNNDIGHLVCFSSEYPLQSLWGAYYSFCFLLRVLYRFQTLVLFQISSSLSFSLCNSIFSRARGFHFDEAYGSILLSIGHVFSVHYNSLLDLKIQMVYIFQKTISFISLSYFHINCET